jgi:hypothetical protein
MAARAPRGWVFTFGLAALAVAAGWVARAITPASASALHTAEEERCLQYGRVECCLRLDESR